MLYRPTVIDVDDIEDNLDQNKTHIWHKTAAGCEDGNTQVYGQTSGVGHKG